MLARETTFGSAGGLRVESGRLTQVPLPESEAAATDDVLYRDGAIVFRTEGWYEALVEVDWDPRERRGSRFIHTAVPGQQPLHSEAINAGVLADISNGKQLLRGNTLFGPHHTPRLALEVWQDSGGSVELKGAALTIRELAVPWLGSR